MPLIQFTSLATGDAIEQDVAAGADLKQSVPPGSYVVQRVAKAYSPPVTLVVPQVGPVEPVITVLVEPSAAGIGTIAEGDGVAAVLARLTEPGSAQLGDGTAVPGVPSLVAALGSTSALTALPVGQAVSHVRWTYAHPGAASKVRHVVVGQTVQAAAAATVPAAVTSSMWSLSDAGTGGALTVEVTALPDDGGSPITAIERQVGGGSWTALGSLAGLGTATITGVANNASTSVRLRAVNAVGAGGQSGAMSATASAPATPTITPGTVYLAPLTAPATRADAEAAVTVGNGTASDGSTVTAGTPEFKHGGTGSGLTGWDSATGWLSITLADGDVARVRVPFTAPGLATVYGYAQTEVAAEAPPLTTTRVGNRIEAAWRDGTPDGTTYDLTVGIGGTSYSVTLTKGVALTAVSPLTIATTGDGQAGDVYAASGGAYFYDTTFGTPSEAYSWTLDGAVVSGADGASHAASAGMLRGRLTVTMSGGGAPLEMTSAPVTVAAAPAGTAPENTVPPTITGVSNPPRVGETMTAGDGSWSGSTPMTFARQWTRNGAFVGSGGPGFTLSSSDLGAVMGLTVTASNGTAPDGVEDATPTGAVVAAASGVTANGGAGKITVTSVTLPPVPTATGGAGKITVTAA